MSPKTLLEELKSARVWVSLDGDRLRVEGSPTPIQLGRVRALEAELCACLREEAAAWERALVEWTANYVLAMARVHDFDEETANRAASMVRSASRVGHYRVTRDAIEIAVDEGAVVRFRKPPAYACPNYEPLPGVKRCVSYHSSGACMRDDEFMCVEFLRVNRARSRLEV
jgi:hypothetical protein